MSNEPKEILTCFLHNKFVCRCRVYYKLHFPLVYVDLPLLFWMVNVGVVVMSSIAKVRSMTDDQFNKVVQFIAVIVCNI